MIRVKVFGIREILKKLIFFFAISLIILLTVTFLLRLLNTTSRAFAIGVVEGNIEVAEVFSKNELNTKILKNELGIDGKIKKGQIVTRKIEDTQKEFVQNFNVDYTGKNTNEVIKDEKYVETANIHTWNRPSFYETEEFSSGKIRVGNTYITNYSKLNLDLNELSKVSTFPITDKTSVLIFHTHTSEAYSEMGTATNFRTTDDKYNLVAVGNVLKNNFLAKKFDVYHSTTKHDTPSYNGAYRASLQTVENLFKAKKYDIVFDIHRDALSGNLNYRPTAEINGESAAKLMFVVGTNACGLSHPNWIENLKLALLIQNTANEMYPGLFRDLNLSKSRYNQHVCNGALIIEVGATGNTLDEAKIAMKYLSNVIEALKNKI